MESINALFILIITFIYYQRIIIIGPWLLKRRDIRKVTVVLITKSQYKELKNLTTTTNGEFIPQEEIDKMCLQPKCKNHKPIRTKGKILDFCRKYNTWCFNALVSCRDEISLQKEKTLKQTKFRVI